MTPLNSRKTFEAEHFINLFKNYTYGKQNESRIKNIRRQI